MLRTSNNPTNAAPRNSSKQKFCRYCRETDEPSIVYQGHYTYFPDGKPLCPKMKTKGCLYCGVKEDKSHCNTECPKWKTKLSSARRQSSVVKKEQNTFITQKSNKRKDQPLRVRLLKKLLKQSIMQKKLIRKRMLM